MSLREQVIQRVYDECADFAERNGVSDAAAESLADFLWWCLRQMWPDLARWPVFYFEETNDRFIHRVKLCDDAPERLIEYVHV